ncbi:Glycosyltransferase (modular protein) [Oenococcus oeni]|nr:Glycosyltransferase (modular protein) [Oenococcus oeni]
MPWNGSLFQIVFGILLILSEIISSFTAFIFIYNKSKFKEISEPKVGKKKFPNVDIVIATHNESYDILYKTVNAACHIKYPDKKKVHIYISDDSNREYVRRLAKEFSIKYISIENNKHAKSGNLNNALKQMSSPLVANFDADMIPFSDFLMETVPFYITNFKKINKKNSSEKIKPLGLIQTPQSFYNPDIFQYNIFAEKKLTNEQDFFSREINVLNNSSGSAVYTGSNTLILRKAIDEVGGFPTDTVTEDFELGVLINSHGYESMSTLEPMASGLTPTDFRSMLKQRTRWARGVVRSFYNVHILTNKNLTLPQRLTFLNSYLYWWSFLRRLLYIVAPIIFVLSGIKVVDANFWLLMFLWAPAYFLLHHSLSVASGNIRTERWGEIQETVLAPYLFIPVLLETIGIKEKKFKVTNKDSSSNKFQLLYALPYILLWILVFVSIVKFNYGKFGSEIMYGSVITFWLLTHLFNLTFAIFICIRRPIYRKFERFKLNTDCLIKQRGRKFKLKTNDVSESGISVISNHPIYLNPNLPVTVVIRRNRYQAKFKCDLIRVASDNNTWTYAFKIVKFKKKSFNEYLQIIYDGFNNYLPTERDQWLTAWDVLLINISKRLSFDKGTKKINHQKSDSADFYPNVSVNETAEVNHVSAKITNFAFNFLILKFEDSIDDFKDHERIICHDVIFKSNHVSKYGVNSYRFDISNLKKLSKQNHFKELVRKWGIVF